MTDRQRTHNPRLLRIKYLSISQKTFSSQKNEIKFTFPSSRKHNHLTSTNCKKTNKITLKFKEL